MMEAGNIKKMPLDGNPIIAAVFLLSRETALPLPDPIFINRKQGDV
jgi:hypothetical protein